MFCIGMGGGAIGVVSGLHWVALDVFSGMAVWLIDIVV